MADQKHVVIMGAGFSGLGAAIQLKKKYPDVSYTIYERAHDVGGSWRDNSYPGCGCDVVSHYYSISTAPNPKWSLEYSLQPEIYQYLRDTASRNDLMKHIEFNTRVADVFWDENERKYHLTMERLDKEGQIISMARAEAHIVICAIGVFDVPVMPTIKGIETFKGEMFHSMRWRHDVPLKGKRVAVIGNGASATQIVPAISEDETIEVTNFARNPNWFSPRVQFKFSETWHWMFTYIPFFALLYRWYHYLKVDLLWIFWDKRNTLARRYIHWKSSRYIRATAPAKYQDKLIPSFDFGCKRLLRDPDYLVSLHRKNVTLETEAIQEIVEDGIVTKDGRKHIFDVIVAATGSRNAASLMSFTGVGGKTAAQLWQEGQGPVSHKTISQPYLPNFYTIMGPNSGSGHGSAVFSQEVCINLIMQLIKPIVQGKADAVTVTPEATKRWDDMVQERTKDTVWVSCTSYYNMYGGRNVAMFPGSNTSFWRHLRKADWSEYEVTPAKRVKAE